MLSVIFSQLLNCIISPGIPWSRGSNARVSERRRTNARWNLNLNLARYNPRIHLNAKTLPPEVGYRWRPTHWPIHFTIGPSPLSSLNFAVRISLYLARIPAVIDASICVSETSSEMSNVAISPGRKSYVSMSRTSLYIAASSISSTVTDTLRSSCDTLRYLDADIFIRWKPYVQVNPAVDFWSWSILLILDVANFSRDAKIKKMEQKITVLKGKIKLCGREDEGKECTEWKG